MTQNKSKLEISKKYHECAVQFAEIISQIEDLRIRCHWLQNDTGDNGDPYYDLEEVLKKCANALSSMVVYADEYEKDALSKEKEKTES